MPRPVYVLRQSFSLGISLGLLLALGCNGEHIAANAAAAEAEPAAVAAPAEHTDGGEVVAISGPGGVTSPALPAGAFLGKGGRLEVGQALETPRGTLAELRLPGGIRVRMNEDTAMTLPGTEAAARLVLTRGEIVVLTEPGATAELSVAAGDEVLTISRGEAQIRNAGPTRRFAVIDGTASLQAPSRSLTLAPGESIDAPLPEERTRKPELSLAPLQETGWSHTFEAAARLADEAPAGVGSLTARRPGSRNERQRLALTDQRVTVNITGRLAHTEIEQAFFNDRGAVLEGIYRFPLPGDGSVSGLSLLVGNRWMEGEIVEKSRARRIFSSIVDATIPRDPALLEWERGNQFKLRIFPIPGRGERRVRLAYTQVLPVAGQTLRYRFPMAGSGAGGTEIERFEFQVTIDGQRLDEAQLAQIGTPMMALDRTRLGSDVQLRATRTHFVPTADIGVDIPVAEDEARIHTATHLDRDGQAYFMVAAQPELELPRPEGPTSYAFVLDRSHSTSPELWTAARGMVEALATSMEPDDRFAVLACDTACDQAPGGMLAAQAGDLDEVQRFLDAQDLAGASDLGGMMTSAAEALERGGAPGQRVIVYLGDGTPSSGEMAADRLASLVAEPLRDHRVMAVALGARSDLTTLSAIVQQTGGDILEADARDDRQQLVRELRLRARVPVVHDLELDLPDGMVAVHRHGTGGIRPGDSLVLLGKLSRAVHDEVILRARGPQGPIEARFRVDLEAERDSPEQHRHLPRTWAQAEIADLTQTRGFDARDQIVALSKHYTVMSRFSSLLVLENDAMYREFNVVRAAKNTDKWNGRVEEDKKQEDELRSAASGSRATATTEEKSGRFGSSPSSPSPDDGTLRKEAGGEGDVSASADRFKDVDVAEPEEEDLDDRRSPSQDPAPPPSVPGGVAGGVVGGVPGGASGGGMSPKGSDHGSGKGLGPVHDHGDFDDPDPFAKNEPVPAEEPSDVSLGDDEGDAGGTRSGSAPARPEKKQKPKKKKKSKPTTKRDWNEPMGGGSSSGRRSGGWSKPGKRRGWSPPVRRLHTRPVGSPSARALARVEDLRRTVDADPTQRSAHGKLVRAALRAHHSGALEFARAWAEVDPDHAPALTSLADAMAADGDPMALRAYESALEVRPFVERRHAELARAYEGEGDLTRACSHRRAVVSIDPQDGKHHAELARCLERAGRRRQALDALVDGRANAASSLTTLAEADAEVTGGIVRAASFDLHSRNQLKATLTWTGEDDLDLAVVDAKGRRLSAMRPEGKARVQETPGHEQLTLRKVRKSVFIEITRPTPSRAPEGERGTVRGELHLKTPHGTRRIPFSIREGSVRVAKVFWSTR
ncbi:MAG: FecR domain-containing protein [Deltaproteobacteria bacterium]|nr:FecR domain-containing protein [Deltaproteobacteria bacterium]